MNSFRDYDKRIARMNKYFPVKPIDILFDFGRIEGGLFSKKVMQVAFTDTQFCIINEEFKIAVCAKYEDITSVVWGSFLLLKNALKR